ncbi:hypothetical protein ILYODFUR_008435 [Ilyodon furcidens]|uniref:Uncharacterized protein n=1 Tax=Ilyodon furcidens TaxID=33524 RepID=A0ABV0UQF6_9TELE
MDISRPVCRCGGWANGGEPAGTQRKPGMFLLYGTKFFDRRRRLLLITALRQNNLKCSFIGSRRTTRQLSASQQPLSGLAAHHGLRGGRCSAGFNPRTPEGERLQRSCPAAGGTSNSGGDASGELKPT